MKRNNRKRNNLEFYDLSAAEWWNQNTKIYTLNALNPARFSYFDRYLPTWQNLRVLDVGCGGGFSCEFMAKRGAIVTGIDQSAACIKVAAQHAIANNLKIDYHCGVAEQLPFKNAQFDCVVCVDVLEHVADLDQTIREIHRVLRPGGHFFFDTINRTIQSKIIMIWLLEDWLKEIPSGIHDWNQFIPPKHLIQQLQQTGFATIAIDGFDLFGGTVWGNIQAYFYYQKNKDFQIKINRNLSVMYIGKAVKPFE